MVGCWGEGALVGCWGGVVVGCWGGEETTQDLAFVVIAEIPLSAILIANATNIIVFSRTIHHDGTGTSEPCGPRVCCRYFPPFIAQVVRTYGPGLLFLVL